MKVSAVGTWEQGTCWEVEMMEGRKREVRRLFQAIGAPVKRLIRRKIGPLSLGQLPPGKARTLTRAEVIALYRASKPILRSQGQREQNARYWGLSLIHI